jgi:hypothetical protein
MGNRILPTVFLGIALLSSGWGSVLAASFCPHFAWKQSYHLNQPSFKMQSHETCDMGMSDMQMEATDNFQPQPGGSVSQTDMTSEFNADTDILDQPGESCPHCVMHSHPAFAAVSSRAITDEKRPFETETPSAAGVLISPCPGFVFAPGPRAHAPPGESFRRHVLLSVFRI